jgi:mono/diheme cytochrome c family protein
MIPRLLPFLACAIACGIFAEARAADPVAQFEREVRPLLEERCFECHGPEKQKGGLRLDQKAGILGQGDSESPAVIPGNHAGSEVIKRILSTDPDETMPPKGKRLTPEEIASIKQWIDKGAHWPPSKEPEPEIAAAPQAMAVTAKDREFWAFQKPQRKTAAVQNDPWIRQPIDGFILARMRERGLAPTHEAARERFIRRATFDITGLPPTPEEVDRFLADQSDEAHARLVDRLLASARFGERLASMWLPLARYAEDQAHQVGDDTKFFYGNAHLYRAWVIDAFNRDLPYDQFLKLQLAADVLPSSRSADLAALGFLGLGPKYYNRNRVEVMADEWEDRVDTVSRTMLGLTVACARCHDHKFDPITAADYHALAGVFASTRMVNRMPDGTPEKENTMADKLHPATLHVVEEGDLQNLNVFIRGNVTRKGPVVPRRFLAVLSQDEPESFRAGSGRAELAEAIASADNPLTARVIVNRVWGLFFGQPLVSTPSNFGHSGATPSHPELLDDLAVRFAEGGWSIKSLVREITLSATYRQRSDGTAESAQQDPDNELLSRMSRRRLSIEQWRDAVLAVSGELTEAPGARSRELDDPANSLRTVYARISRLKLNDLLMQFDYPDANVHAEKRSVTTTPTQKLFLLNSPFVQKRAAAFAMRLQTIEAGDEERLIAAYRLLFGRAPDDRERALGIAFLRQAPTADLPQWERYAQLLLVSNEMLYVD